MKPEQYTRDEDGIVSFLRTQDDWVGLAEVRRVVWAGKSDDNNNRALSACVGRLVKIGRVVKRGGWVGRFEIRLAGGAT